MGPSRVPFPLAPVARRAVLLVVAAGLALGLAVAEPPQRASALPTGICGLTINCVAVTVTPSGNGSGTAVGKYLGHGIDCHYANGVLTGTCLYQYKWAGTGWLYLDITYTPDAHSGLCYLTGAITCYGAGVTQTNTIGFSPTSPPDTEDSYGFQLLPETMTVTRTGVGTGTVASSAQPGISCGSICSAQFDYGTSVKLTAKPDAGAVFTAWTGACAGQGKTCTLKLTSNLAANAVFSLPSATPAPTPRPTARPTPRPTVASASGVPPTAGPSSSSPSSSSGTPGDSPLPADTGLTAAAGATSSPGASTAPAQTTLPSAAESGVPVALAVVLVAMALLIGGLTAALLIVLRRGKAN